MSKIDSTYATHMPASPTNDLEKLQKDIQITLQYAPRSMRCPWDGNCSFGPYASINLLLKHIQRVHKPKPENTRELSISCRFARSCKQTFVSSTRLLAHITTQHLGSLMSTCYLCPFQTNVAHTMAIHLASAHGIHRDQLPKRIFLTEPKPPKENWPENMGIIPTYLYMQPMIPPGRADPAGHYPTPKLGEFDFLIEDATDDNAAGTGRARHRNKPEATIFPTSVRPWTEMAEDSPISFYAAIRQPSGPSTLSVGPPYKGLNLPPKTSFPVQTGFLHQRARILPTLSQNNHRV